MPCHPRERQGVLTEASSFPAYSERWFLRGTGPLRCRSGRPRSGCFTCGCARGAASLPDRDLAEDQAAPADSQNFSFSVQEVRSGFVLDINGWARRPFSAAFLGVGCDTFSVSPDIFPDRDLRHDDFFFTLLRLCHSGQMALIHILLLSSDFASTLFERMVKLTHACFTAGAHVLLSQHSSSEVWRAPSVCFSFAGDQG